MSRAVSTSVVILVLLIVLQENPPGPIESIIIITWTVFCLTSLQIFSNMVGKSIEENRKLDREERLSHYKTLSYLVVELFPIYIVFMMTIIGLFTIDIAYKVTIIIIIAILFTYGFTLIRFRTKNIILCILGGIFFVLIALSLVFMRMIIN